LSLFNGSVETQDQFAGAFEYLPWVPNTASVLVPGHGAVSACRWWIGLAEYPLGELKQVAAPGLPVMGMVINVPNVRNVVLLGIDMHRL
jgi:hypothetical protein